MGGSRTTDSGWFLCHLGDGLTRWARVITTFQGPAWFSEVRWRDEQ